MHAEKQEKEEQREEGGDVAPGTTRGLGWLVTQEVFAIQASNTCYYTLSFYSPRKKKVAERADLKPGSATYHQHDLRHPTASFRFVSHLYWRQIVAGSGCGSHDTSKAQGLRARLCDVIALHRFEAQCLAGQP